MLLFSEVLFNWYRFLAFVYRFRDFLQLKPNHGLSVFPVAANGEALGFMSSNVFSADSSNKLHNLLVISFMSIWVTLDQLYQGTFSPFEIFRT